MAWAELADPFERCAWECAKSWSILFCYHKIPDTGPLIRRQGLTGSEGALGVLRHSGWTGARRRHGQVGKRDYESWIWLLPIPIDKVTQSHKTWRPPPRKLWSLPKVRFRKPPSETFNSATVGACLPLYQLLENKQQWQCPPTSWVLGVVPSVTHGFNSMGHMHLQQRLPPSSELSGKTNLLYSLWCKP